MVDGYLVQHVSALVTDIVRHYSLQTPEGKILVYTRRVEIKILKKKRYLLYKESVRTAL
jgi:hypothetical protein